MKNEIFPAFLTPDFPTAARGKVHSVFTRTANIAFCPNGDVRLLTLIPKSLPRLPDSIQVPEDIFDHIKEGMPAEWSKKQLLIGNICFQYEKDNSFDGKIINVSDKIIHPRVNEFLSLTDSLPCGLDRLPSDYREKVTDSLGEGDLSRYVGLGTGLTPSFDDACVGYTAICCALGKPNRIVISDSTDTTDISLRYLRLAQKGYFGEPVCRIIASLTGEGELRKAIELLKAVGATSGCDMIYGMRVAIRALFNSNHM